MRYSALPLVILTHSTAWRYFTLHSGMRGIVASVHLYAYLTFSYSESLFVHCSNVVSAPKLSVPPQVKSVLPETPSQQELYDAKFREHFRTFDIISLKTIFKKLEYPCRLSYNFQKKELIGLLLLLAPADLCETYPSPSDVSIPQKVPRQNLGGSICTRGVIT